MNARLNKRERKAAQLLKHYETCERLAKYLGVANPDGKRISVLLLKAEKIGGIRALRMCNDETYSEADQEYDKERAIVRVRTALGTIPPGFFVNGDPRGYALKIDNELPEGKALIEAVGLQTDWGGFGLLSPEITGD